MLLYCYTLSEAWSAVDWADLMAAQGAFGTDFCDRSTRTIVGTMLWTEYRPVIKIGTKGALGSDEIRLFHSTPSLGQSIGVQCTKMNLKLYFSGDGCIFFRSVSHRPYLSLCTWYGLSI